MRVVLEGLPGAGKTTLTDHLVGFFGARGVVAAAVPEVVHLPGHPRWEDFVYNDWLKLRRAEELERSGTKVVVMDRSGVSTDAYSLAAPERRDTVCMPAPAVDTLWVYCALSNLGQRRRVARPAELWDDDAFASSWERHAVALMHQQAGSFLRINPIQMGRVAASEAILGAVLEHFPGVLLPSVKER